MSVSNVNALFCMPFFARSFLQQDRYDGEMKVPFERVAVLAEKVGSLNVRLAPKAT
jgi:hypothetical protein